MRLLQKIGHVLQNAIFGERQILFQDLILFVLFGKVDQDLRLQARVDVFGQFEGGRIVVHGGDQPEIRVRFDLDAGDDAFHIAAVIEQRRQAGPALFAHAVAFVENRDAAQDHGADQRRSHVAQPARAFDARA